MKTVLILATVIALAAARAQPSLHVYQNLKTESVDAETVQRQYKVLEFFEAISQVNKKADYYKVGKDYDIKAHTGDYLRKEVVDKFFYYYEKEFTTKFEVFSIFNEKMREQAKALYDLFFYAKDFETFYKTAAWARTYINPHMFVYTFYVAFIHRVDTSSLVIPPLYEIAPEFYANREVFQKMYYGKMRGEPFEEYPEYGIMKETEYHFYYTNYSNYFTYGDEYKLAYLTEDIGWNAFYTHFHAIMPFWEEGEYLAHGLFKENRGEIYYHFYQQLLARYYLERLSNGLGEIPTFSWYQPFKYGYRPFLSSKSYPFVQRSSNYFMQNEYHLDDLRFVRNYEDMFLTFLEQGQFKSYHKQVDFSNSKSINFVGNYWQGNPDLYEKLNKPHYHESYETVARRILSGAPFSYKYQDNKVMPSALEFFQTSLRDPAFYQLYNKIVGFMLKYKQYVTPYTQENLHYVGVKVNSVEVDKLETFFDFHGFNATNGIYHTNEELVHNDKQYLIIQPRLNHEPFTVKFEIKSDVEEQATFKVFLGPKYDSYGQVIKFEDNWVNFVELDWFTQKLTKGENTFTRSSSDFFFYKEDAPTTFEIHQFLGENKLPTDHIYNYDNLPKRLMLPRGTTGGFPLQIFVAVYKSVELPKEYEAFKHVILDDKPSGYPLDRPVSKYFLQPNMFVKDVVVYHRGNEYPVSFESVERSNRVVKH